MRHRTTIVLLAAIAVGGGAVVRPLVAAQAPRPSAAFGFALGEERRYVLGPQEALDAGEWAEWSMRLDRLQEGEDGWEAHFALAHDRLERVPGSPNSSELITVNVYGDLVTNLDGFPLKVRYVQEFSVRGETVSGDGVRRIEYVYDRKEKRFDKVVKVGRRDWEFTFGVAKYSHLDFEGPSGLFVFMPTPLECLGSSLVACNEAEPAFGNPGLLSLVMPTLLEEASGERDYLFMLPTAIANSPFFAASTAGDWLSYERDSIGNIARYYDQRKVKLGASTEVQVGPRTMHAWELDLGGGIDKVWVEPEGRVLRVELETTYDIRDDRHIRLVFPSERFTSPNADPAQQCC